VLCWADRSTVINFSAMEIVCIGSNGDINQEKVNSIWSRGWVIRKNASERS
jgi:hypothetical protein